MLAQEYIGQNVTGWHMSEKLDGFRAMWNGRQLVSREGNAFRAPAWFIKELPAGVVLDGELYAGRGNLKIVKSTVTKRVPVDAEWKRITFHVFEAPLSAATYEERQTAAFMAIRQSLVAEIVSYRRCHGDDNLNEYFFEVVNHGGEGLILRRPGSPYEQKRSGNLLKFKP